MRAVDVLVVGGGPTGLIITYAMLKAGLDVLAVEQHSNEHQAIYGRACMLYARSLEILDQLELYDGIAEVGFIVRHAVTYKGREEFATRGWTFISQALEGQTHFDFSFSIRQNMFEQAIRRAIYELNPEALVVPARFLHFTVDSAHGYPVLGQVELDGSITEIRSKYIIGADGGRSTVRSIARIPFSGVTSSFRWIRLDAIVRTDMPAGRRCGVALESANHGTILWTPTDNGRTRIGFVCSPALYGKNGESITADVVIAEAQAALKPFTVDFVQLDWWTVYGIGQRIAENFREGPVFLAGDSAHTHSSGAAQGMNTGIHDASNLSWKLAGVLKGWYIDAILDTYVTERQASAQHVLQLDKDIASLTSGIIPGHFNAPPDADVNVYLDKVFNESAGFLVGLGVSYTENLINQNTLGRGAMKSVQIGHRAPDPPLHRPGARFPKRLQEFTPNNGRFWILVFVGGLDPASEQPRLHPTGVDKFAALRAYIESPTSFVNTLAPAFEFLTIVRGNRILQTAETLGGQPLGKAVYDQTGDAYKLYGVSEGDGAIVVLRPDGIISFAAALDKFHTVEQYFTPFVRKIGSKIEFVCKDACNMETFSVEGNQST